MFSRAPTHKYQYLIRPCFRFILAQNPRHVKFATGIWRFSPIGLQPGSIVGFTPPLYLRRTQNSSKAVLT